METIRKLSRQSPRVIRDVLTALVRAGAITEAELDAALYSTTGVVSENSRARLSQALHRRGWLVGDKRNPGRLRLAHGRAAEISACLGVSPKHLSDCLGGRIIPSDAIMSQLATIPEA